MGCGLGKISRNEGRASEREHTAQEEAASLGVRGDTLKKCKSIANTIRSCSGQLRRIEERVDRDDLLQQRGHDT